MWLLIPTAFFLTASVLAVKFKESICDTIAMTGAMQILALYLLAVIGEMRAIYVIALLIIAFFVLIIYAEHCIKEASLASKVVNINSKKRVFRRCLKVFFKPSVITFILVLTAVTYLTKDQIFTWWDDINFWSSDAKQLFYLNRFPGKYGNVSPEFGDYPPVTSLFKWVFLQISPGRYIEGLQFAGYFALNAVFLMPLVKAVRDKLSAPATLLAFMVPGIVNGIIFYGTPADITMGIIYGALLYAIWDKRDHAGLFYYGRIALYAAVLFLTKSVGIEWALFALLFYFMLGYKERGIIFASLFSASFYGSWLLFCLINRRVAKATGLGIKMATGSYSVPANALDKARYFFLGLWTMPMHADHNITFDLPIGAVIILIFAAFIVMVKKGIIAREQAKPIGIFLLISAIISHAIIFIAHISLFQAEDQYLDAFAMTNSIARYGAPFTIGGIYLLAGMAFTKARRYEKLSEKSDDPDNNKKALLIYIAFAAFVLLTADYKGMYKYLAGYRTELADNKTYNGDMIDDGGEMFIEAVYGHRDLWGHRVLNLRSGESNHWVHDTYISKEASPVPAVYDTLTEADTVATICEKISSSHAEYLFAEAPSVGEETMAETFNTITEGEEYFKFWKIYRIEKSGNDIKLYPVYLY
ncbi:hypothetical protein [Butyrivibrio sp. AD3002]|uniref:hypothetical protein n=1 Tax=Butyrivibrio sp. AD3002 TaxID=1280670 RepID=UPI0003B68F19|nr:hypothetical protein [Butyrivibrio sp. AD3002]